MALLVTESRLRLIKICRASSGLTLTSELRSTLTSKLRGSLALAVLTPVSASLDAASVDVCRVSGTHADAGLH